MKILMVYPRYPVTFWSFKYILKYVSKKAAFPPLGLLTVAAMLPRHWEVRLVDLNVRKLSDEDILWADYVMVSAMIVQEASVHEILARCQRLGKKVIAGGPLFAAMPEAYTELVEHLILGEAEATLPPFLEDLAAGCPRKLYTTEKFPSLEGTPVPRWDLIDVHSYATLMIQYSRGCPFDCEFCNVTAMFGHRPRTKSTAQFLTELEAIYAAGGRGSVFVVDDNFIGNRKAIKAMLPALIAWMQVHDHPFRLFTEASIDIADDDELLGLMVKAGFDSVFIGLETPNEDSLRECEKHQNRRRDMTAAIRKLQASGLQVFGGYIVGFDHDDESIFARQIRFIQETGVVTAMVGLLNAMPNTRLWRRLEAENRLERHPTGNNTDGSINFVPVMDRQKLLAGYRRIVKTIYSPRHYYQRVSAFLASYRPHPQRQPLSWDRLTAFLWSIFYLGILGNGPSQWYYWKILFKSLVSYPRAFREVITLMIYGHHFRKVSKSI